MTRLQMVSSYDFVNSQARRFNIRSSRPTRAAAIINNQGAVLTGESIQLIATRAEVVHRTLLVKRWPGVHVGPMNWVRDTIFSNPQRSMLLSEGLAPACEGSPVSVKIRVAP